MAEPIAIIGTGCRFPGGVSSPSSLWSLLTQPRDLSQRIPSDRFHGDSFYHPIGKHHGTTNVQQAYFLEGGIRAFDASFFNISAKEAEAIDPQQRLVLETVYEAVERAGLRVGALRGSETGVFCGVMCDDYSEILARDLEQLPQYTSTGVARNNVSNRVSYFFDWRGPSMTVDTACSSSLVAVHLAVQALRSGSCRIAIASGTNLISSPHFFMAASTLNMLSPTGRSRMWDVDADGYARGEAVASVVLKPLSDAIRDGDPIECVVRETGVNQDGRTMGITMPSGPAQARLIRATYEKAGLRWDSREDRCQYFEAHGTGTQAGDPQEASAISGAFFGPGSKSTETETTAEKNELIVGSVKTIVGHTEGTAGLAGLIKASLCLQHGAISPNLHLATLNPKVRPYYDNLRIPTSVEPWPTTAPGVPRRASINSFGFGGTNAHAIIESFGAPSPTIPRLLTAGPAEETKLEVPLPFVFSATSDLALGNLLTAWSTFLSTPRGSTLPPTVLSSLLATRDDYTHRLILRAPSTASLAAQLDAELTRRADRKATTVVRRPAVLGSKKILGIFSGQGAQWARMGYELVSSNPAARAWLGEMQSALDTLAPAYRPTYNLLEELSLAGKASRVGQAAISQPLCTAVQVVLVNLLRAVGIELTAVVGHSSGEIGAAYAAGFVSASDAIRIAHLRGMFAKFAAGPNNAPGGMLAAGLSVEDAKAFVAQPQFRGRITVAAFNSNESATLSGDADAIAEAAGILTAEGKFARALRVDTAYHSHHMAPCGAGYLAALKQSISAAGQSKVGTTWFSSVTGGDKVDGSAQWRLGDGYWNDNMQKPVLFTQAVTAAIQGSEPFDLVLELGPHPALKGPTQTTMAALVSGDAAPPPEVPYVSLLQRGSSALDTVANGLGQLWTFLGPDVCRIQGYVDLFGVESGVTTATLLKEVPTYAFDHTQTYWAEPRASKAMSQRPRPNLLLGSQQLDTATEGEFRWRNFLKRDEIEWLDGHQIEGQTVFPATGYVAMALEAARIIVADKPLKGIEIEEFYVGQAISIDANNVTGVETLFKVERTAETKTKAGHKQVFNFACHALLNTHLRRCAHGTMTLVLGEQTPTLLPGSTLFPESQREEEEIQNLVDAGLTSVDIPTFYTYLTTLGYNYTSLFRGITHLHRRKDTAAGYLSNAAHSPTSPGETPLLLHPATMDTLLQTVLASIGAPYDGRLGSVFVPTKIERIVVNPAFGGPEGMGPKIGFEARLTGYGPGGIQGDVDAYDAASGGCVLRMEGVKVSPLTKLTEENDRLMFSEVVWGAAEVSLSAFPAEKTPEVDLAKEKAVLLFMDRIFHAVTAPRDTLSAHANRVLAWFAHVLYLTKTGEHPVCQATWLQEDLSAVLAQLPSTLDTEAVRAIGDSLASALTSPQPQQIIMDVLREADILTKLSRELLAMSLPKKQLTSAAAQLAFRYPHLRVLELGASTGETTEAVLAGLDKAYYSYTITDTHPAFFPDLQSRFASHSERLVCKTLDVQADLKGQGFVEGSYDLIVAANTLHAADSLTSTLARVRSLLRPGGYLLLAEGTNPDALLGNFIYCGFEKHWVGAAEGRVWTPLVSAEKWDTLLRGAGFSGVDVLSPGHERGSNLAPFSVVVSQAVDATQSFLRAPLSTKEEVITDKGHLVIIPPVNGTDLIKSVTALLTPFYSSITTLPTLQGLTDQQLSTLTPTLPTSNLTTLSLTDTHPSTTFSSSAFTFANLSGPAFNALKHLTDTSSRFLWVTAGSESTNPHASMAKGLMASVAYENPHALFQYLNVVDQSASTTGSQFARTVASAVLRVQVANPENAFDFAAAGEGKGRVWATEGEVRVEGGKVYIPRAKQHDAMNKRYMAERRVVEDTVGDVYSGAGVRVVGVSDSDVDLDDSTAQPGLVRQTTFPTELEVAQGPLLTLYTTHSVSTPLTFPAVGQLYPVLATIPGSPQARVLALTPVNASVIRVPSTHTFPVPSYVSPRDEAAYLYQVVAQILAGQIVGMVRPGGKVVLSGEDEVVREAVAGVAAGLGVGVVSVGVEVQETKLPEKVGEESGNKRDSGVWAFDSDSEDGDGIVKVVRVGEMVTARELADKVGVRGVAVVVNFGTTDAVTIRLDALLPARVRRETLATLLAKPVSISATRHTKTTIPAFELAAAAYPPTVPLPDITLPVQSLTTTTLSSPGSLNVLVWDTTPLTLPARPASSTLPLSPHKTYLLAGMTGDTGRSLARFLIARGARHIVLTSRNPKPPSWQWYQEIDSLGAQVVTMAMDVTSLASVKGVVEAVERDMPAIGGVVNGAMVLTDKIFSSMTLSEWEGTVNPKVLGSAVLDEVFSGSAGEDLDFFIMMGSVSGPLGNSSQSAYSAANNFMASLVAGRRARGLVGSVISPAQILGVGYVAHADAWLLEHLHQVNGCYPVSEQDLHELFAEGIVAGKVGAGGGAETAEVIAGFRKASPTTQKDIIWYRNTKMWGFIAHSLEDAASSGAGDASGSGRVSVKDQLAGAASLAEVVALIETAFAAKLKNKLQLAEDVQIVSEAAPAELGVDSLVAVDLRTWFVKEVGVDVPVLKILGGMTLGGLSGEVGGKVWKARE